LHKGEALFVTAFAILFGSLTLTVPLFAASTEQALYSFNLNGADGITPIAANLANSWPGSSFTLSASPNSETVTKGSNRTSTITIKRKNTFDQPVTLSATGLPSGVTVSFSPNPATSTSTLTLKASGSAAVGAATITITGSSGSLSRTTTVKLKVRGVKRQ
jgi:hypothetical protein